ncbi:10188_t:CDS:2, partial [Gigaspora margarita]
YGNLEMQQQIQRFLEEYFKNPKSSNKKTTESNKPLASNGNGTTTLKGKGILQEKDQTENLAHHKDITKPVMSTYAQEIQAPLTKRTNEQTKPLNSSYPESDKENIQPVDMQSVKEKNTLNKQQTDKLQSDNKRFKVKENPSNYTEHTEPNEKSMMDLLYNIMSRLEIIESNQKGATNASISKHKGSEVGLLVRKDLEKHIGKIERPN